MIAETSEHNIYADAGLSSPIRLSSVMILKFLLSLYDCTISTTLPVHLINLNNILLSLSGKKKTILHTWMCGSEFSGMNWANITAWYDLI